MIPHDPRYARYRLAEDLSEELHRAYRLQGLGYVLLSTLVTMVAFVHICLPEPAKSGSTTAEWEGGVSVIEMRMEDEMEREVGMEVAGNPKRVGWSDAQTSRCVLQRCAPAICIEYQGRLAPGESAARRAVLSRSSNRLVPKVLDVLYLTASTPCMSLPPHPPSMARR